MAEEIDPNSLVELVDLLRPLPASHPLIAITLRSFSSATCSASVIASISNHTPFCSFLVSMINMDSELPGNVLNQEALLQTLINLSSGEQFAAAFSVELERNVCTVLKDLDQKPALKNLSLLDKLMAVLSNLSRRHIYAQSIFDNLGEATLRRLISVFDAANNDPKKAQLMFLPSLFVNLSRLPEFRSFLMNEKTETFQRLLPFMDQKFPFTIRAGIVRLVRNCTFDSDLHPWFLSEKVHLLTHLLLPLIGPEDYDDVFAALTACTYFSHAHIVFALHKFQNMEDQTPTSFHVKGDDKKIKKEPATDDALHSDSGGEEISLGMPLGARISYHAGLNLEERDAFKLCFPMYNSISPDEPVAGGGDNVSRLISKIRSKMESMDPDQKGQQSEVAGIREEDLNEENGFSDGPTPLHQTESLTDLMANLRQEDEKHKQDLILSKLNMAESSHSVGDVAANATTRNMPVVHNKKQKSRNLANFHEGHTS